MERVEHLPFKQLYDQEVQRLQDADCIRSARMEGMGLLLFINPDVGSTSFSEDRLSTDNHDFDFDRPE